MQNTRDELESGNRHERRKAKALVRHWPQLSKQLNENGRIERQKQEHRDAVKRKQDATHRRVMLRKKTSETETRGIAVTHLEDKVLKPIG